MNRNAVRRTLVECYDEALGDWRRRFEEEVPESLRFGLCLSLQQ